MENKSIFISYLLTWILYIAGIHAYGVRWRLSQTAVCLSHAVPSLIAISMAWIFLIGHGVTVRQFVGNSERGMDLWSLWCGLWPLLLLTTFVVGFSQIVMTIAVAVNREFRKWVPVAALSAGMCAFAFMTVLSNFPDA